MTISDKVIIDLFRTHNQELSNFARRRVGRQEAEDVVQDTYLRLLREGRTGTLEHPRSYLFRIASNLAVDAKRKTKVRANHHVDGVDFDRLSQNLSGRPVNNAVDVICLQRCLARLPPLCRSVFILNKCYGLTYPEIASRLEISLRTVNRKMTKASTYLNKYFES
ncbi:MAG: RNA polymerase sigma factor [Methylocystis sp.]